MKIAVISPSEKHLNEVTSALQAAGHETLHVQGGKGQLHAVAQQHHPDILIADGLCCDVDELSQVEHATTQFPQTAVVLMCSRHTPEYLLHAMRAGVREVLPSPVAPEALNAAVQRIATKLGRPGPAKTGQVLAFLPCKGGSGATFVATNLAWELAQASAVLLIDLNLQFGDALSFVHDGRPSSTIADVATNIDRLDGSFLAGSAIKVGPSFSVLAAPEDPGEALEVKPEHVEAILSVATRHYDYVVVDLGRALDPSALKALDRASRVFAVLEPSLPAIRHATKLRQVFLSLGYSPQKVRFIVNGCERGAEIGPEQVKRSLGGASVLALGEAAKDVTASINRGEPLVQTSRTHPVVRQIVDLTRELHPQANEDKGLFGRIFRRA